MSREVLQAHLVEPVSAHDHSQGPADALVTLVEYGDYQCPACGAAYQYLSEIRGAFGNELRFVFRNFPLSTVHPNARDAALAAEAANLQGQFWPMHDLLYENQEALEQDDLKAYAQALNLDLDRFVEDFQSEEGRRRVHQDFLSGARSGVNGTPTFFINGFRYDGPNDYASLANAIQQVVRGSM